MSTLSLTLSQVRYVNKAYWRNPSLAFFTFVFPLMFLVIFTSLLGNFNIHIGRVTVSSSSYYVAAMAAFAVVTSCYTNLAISMSFQRDAGVLKRVDGSPMPRAVFMGAKILHSLVITVMLMILTAGFGRAFYDASIPTGLSLLRFIVMLVVGATSFCALGLAMTALVPNADAAGAVVNASILPLMFISGIFIPFGNSTPEWIIWVARIFPVKHFAAGMLAGFVGTTFDWTDVVVVGVWGLAGLYLATRFFSWEPRV